MTAEELLLSKTDQLISVDLSLTGTWEITAWLGTIGKMDVTLWNGRCLQDQAPIMPLWAGAIYSAAFDATAKWIAVSVREAIAKGKLAAAQVGEAERTGVNA